MKLAILGTGMIVNSLLGFVKDVPAIELAAILSTKRSRATAETLQKEHGIRKLYLDYSELLSDPDIDTVYVALPNHLHFAFSKQALLAGKHVICEKPFTSNLAEFNELAELALENKLILLEAITNQYLKNYLSIKEDLPKLGEIKIVECNYSQYSSRYDAFKRGEILPAFDVNKSGGALMDLNIYNIHYVVGLFGAPIHVEYFANIEQGIDTSGMLFLDYGTFKCVCIGAKDCTAPITSTIQGNKGSLLVEGPVSIIENYQLIPNGQSPEIIDHKDHSFRMYDEFAAFAEIIDLGQIEVAQDMLAHSRTVMTIIDQAKTSAGLVFTADKK